MGTRSKQGLAPENAVRRLLNPDEEETLIYDLANGNRHARRRARTLLRRDDKRRRKALR